MAVQDMENIFQEKIDKEIKIEPKDWMPDAYRKTNTLRQHAYNFAVGMLADLPGIGLAVRIRHPVLRFDLYFFIDLLLEDILHILYGHNL